MKYVYIRQIIIIIGFVVAIFGSYFCMQKGYQYSLNISEEYSDERAEFYVKDSTGNLDASSISKFIDVTEKTREYWEIYSIWWLYNMYSYWNYNCEKSR